MTMTSALAKAPERAPPAEAHDLVTITTAAAAFRIDRHEVTIGQFRGFVSATGTQTTAEQAGGGFQFRAGWERMAGWTWAAPYGRPGAADEPAVHVTYDEADAYCRWAGLRLPTDLEWLTAAYTETRHNPEPPFVPRRTYPYPTGDSPEAANQTASSARHDTRGPAGQLGQGNGHVPVRSTKAGVNGLYDMGANVWEWVDQGDREKRTRGGSWWYGPAQMRADAVYDKPRDFPAVYIGFRCAADAG
jgi:formylglycine-generating enzyme required for sulfatase activity